MRAFSLQYLARATGQLCFACAAAVLFGSVVFAANLYRGTSPDAMTREMLPVSKEAPAIKAMPVPQWRRQMASWHLMGEIDLQQFEDSSSKPDKENDPVNNTPADPQSLPESQTGFRLTGVIAADTDRHARAVIATPAGLEREYAIGDELSSGIVVESIQTLSIVIRRNGIPEALRLPKLRVGTQGVSRAPASLVLARVRNVVQARTRQRSTASNRVDEYAANALSD